MKKNPKDRLYEAFQNVTGIKPPIEEAGMLPESGFITDKVETVIQSVDRWEVFEEYSKKYSNAAEYTITQSTSKVKWAGELSARHWGLTGLVIIVNSVYFVVGLKFIDAQGNILGEDQVEFDSTKTNFQMEISAITRKITEDVYPSRVEVDFEQKKVLISF